MDFLFTPWPWYVAGPVIGLTVPVLLLMGNKNLGISSTMRQVCEACIPSSPKDYDWRKDIWNLFFAGGVLIGGFIGGFLLKNPLPTDLAQSALASFSQQRLSVSNGFLPVEYFSWSSLLTLKGFILIGVGGFLVGFGTRYAQGCTSGHGILGLSALQWPSLIATASFFLGGILMSQFLLPFILAL